MTAPEGHSGNCDAHQPIERTVAAGSEGRARRAGARERAAPIAVSREGERTGAVPATAASGRDASVERPGS
ncbi:MAG: hypothetical protein ACRDQZ_20675, partial [Mycobacteriales bacterium]